MTRFSVMSSKAINPSNKRVPAGYWGLLFGVGQPPTWTSLTRMARQRNAKGREIAARKATGKKHGSTLAIIDLLAGASRSKGPGPDGVQNAEGQEARAPVRDAQGDGVHTPADDDNSAQDAGNDRPGDEESVQDQEPLARDIGDDNDGVDNRVADGDANHNGEGANDDNAINNGAYDADGTGGHGATGSNQEPSTGH